MRCASILTASTTYIRTLIIYFIQQIISLSGFEIKADRLINFTSFDTNFVLHFNKPYNKFIKIKSRNMSRNRVKYLLFLFNFSLTLRIHDAECNRFLYNNKIINFLLHCSYCKYKYLKIISNYILKCSLKNLNFKSPK